jgi:hypothetical protein
VTLNDLGDADAGANELQNFPVILQAVPGASTHVSVTLDSLPDSDFLISFYASDVADPTGFGQGRRYLGSATIHTDSTGAAAIDLDLPTSTSGSQFLTATATDSDGNTSEFSRAVPLTVTVRRAGGACGSRPGMSFPREFYRRRLP